VGWVIQNGMPLLVPDVNKEPRFYKDIQKILNFHTKNILCVPLQSKSKIIGAIELINKKNTSVFTAEDIQESVSENLMITVVESGVPGAVTDLNAIPGEALLDLSWTPRPADEEVEEYRIYFSPLSTHLQKSIA